MCFFLQIGKGNTQGNTTEDNRKLTIKSNANFSRNFPANYNHEASVSPENQQKKKNLLKTKYALERK